MRLTPGVRSRHILGALAVALLSWPLPSALAGEEAEPSDEDDVDLDHEKTEVVVGQSQSQVIRESGLPVSVIDPADLAGRTITISDILNRVSGVKIRRTGGIGSVQRISVRGLDGNRVKTYIDGNPLDAPEGVFALDDLPIQVIDRIEVYKGVVPPELGGDGLGAAVNVVTVDLPMNYLDMSYTLESHDAHRGMILAKTTLEKPGIEFGGFASFIDAENDFEGTKPDGSTYVRDHDQYRQFIVASGLSFTKAYFDDFVWEFVYLGNHKNIQGLPGYTGSGTGSDVGAISNIQHAYTRTTTGLIALDLEKDGWLYENLDLVYNAAILRMNTNHVDLSEWSYDFEGNRFPSQFGRGEVGAGPNDSDDWRTEYRQRVNVNAQLARPFALNLNNNLTAAHNQRSDPVNEAHLGLPEFPADTMFTSVTSLSGELSAIDDRWLTVFGGKHYGFTSEGTATSVYGASANTDPEPFRQTSHAAGVSVASRFRITDPFLVKLSYERGARLPSAMEMFGDGVAIVGSVDLQPEKSHNITGGMYLDAPFAAKRAGGSNLRFELNGFAMFIDDLITLGGLLEKNYDNVDEARIVGVDGEVQLELTKHTYFYFNATYQDARNTADFVAGTSQPNYLKGKKLPNMPTFFFNYGTEITLYDLFGEAAGPSELSVFYDGSFMDEFFFAYEVSENQEMRVPRKVLHNVGVQASFQDRRFTVSAEVHNLTNVEHFDLYNMPLPGRTFKMTMRFTYL